MRKCAPETPIALDELFIGATVTIWSRRLTVRGYADERTATAMKTKREESFALVSSENVCRIGRIVHAMQENGLTIAEMKTVAFGTSRLEELETALPRNARALASGTSCAIRAIGCEANAILARLFAHTNDVVRSMDEEHARALGELATGSSSKSPTEHSSLVVVKPSGMAHLGAILDFLCEKKGLDLIQARTLALTRLEAEAFYAVYVDVLDKEEVKMMIDELSCGACVALQLSRLRSPETLVDDIREIVGPRDPEIARVLRPESLRARFGEDKQRNAVHCADLTEDGKLEVDFMFNLPRRTSVVA